MHIKRRSLRWAAALAVPSLLLASVETLLARFAPLPDPFPRRPVHRYHRFLPAWNYWGGPPLEWEWDPGPLHGVRPGPRRIRINRYGFLYSEEKLKRQDPRELRVAVLGGSTAECIALLPNQRWPEQLELLLRRRWPSRQVTVLNLGLSAQGARTHLADVAQHVVHLDVDAMVFLLGANEMYRAAEGYIPLLDPGSFDVPGAGQDGRLLLTRFQIGRRLRSGYRALRRPPAKPYFAATLEQNAALPPLPFEPTVPRSALDEYARDIISLASLATGHRIKVLFVTQPMLWKHILSPEEESVCWTLRFEHDAKPFRLAPGAAARLLEACNAELLRVCQERGYSVLDLAVRLPRSLDVFYDDVHFNDAGAAVVAREVAEALSPLLLSPDPPRKTAQ